MRLNLSAIIWPLLTCGLLVVPAAAQQFTINYEDFASLRNRVDSYERELTLLRERLAAKNDEKQVGEELPACTPFGPGAQEVPLRSKSVKVGGRIFWDHLMYDDKLGNLDLENRTRFDTARIKVEGWVYENVDYRIEMDFGGRNDAEVVNDVARLGKDQVVFKDVYIRYHFLPNAGKVWVGHFKEPFSLEELTSSRFITFMERSNYSRLMQTGRDQGVMYNVHLDPCEQMYLAVGTFRSEDPDNPPDEAEDTSDWTIAARTVWLPYYDFSSDGRFLMHVGANLKREWVGDFTRRFRIGQELTAANLLDFTLIANDLTVDYVGVEGGFVMGPLHGSAEWGHVESDEANFDGHGGYFQVGYFLTGEHKGYKHDRMAFDRTKVFEPWFVVHTPCGKCCGKGAWEVAYRYSYVDAFDTNATGTGTIGKVRSHTWGVNWYQNDYSRIMFNWVHTEAFDRFNQNAVAQGDIEQNWYGIRWQVDF